MSEVSQANGTVGAYGAGAANAATSQDKGKLAGNFDTFLKLLTTQLRNQTPTDPLDVNQFTQQLVQYSTVEQQIQSNEHLENLLATMSAANVASFVNYIGKDVAASGEIAQLAKGKAEWGYDAAASAPEALVRISDEAGNVVYTELASLDAGKGSFAWDGRDQSGAIMPDGFYKMSVLGSDQGRPVVVNPRAVEGKVSAVDMTGTQPALTVDGLTVPLSSVTKVLTSS